MLCLDGIKQHKYIAVYPMLMGGYYYYFKTNKKHTKNTQKTQKKHTKNTKKTQKKTLKLEFNPPEESVVISE